MSELGGEKKGRKHERNDWRNCTSDAQKKVHGRVNLPISARVLGELDTRGQSRVRQFTNGFPAMGNVGEPGVYPVDKSRKQPELEPGTKCRK